MMVDTAGTRVVHYVGVLLGFLREVRKPEEARSAGAGLPVAISHQ
jgi:hypothetical protein